MVTNYANKNTGKLLVAVLAMLMIVAGAAVVLSDETSAATTPVVSEDGTTATVYDSDGLAAVLAGIGSQEQDAPYADVTTISLANDINLGQIAAKNGYVIDKAVTINGNDHTISGTLYNDASAKLIVVQNVNTTGAKVVFNDVKLTGALNVYMSNVDLNDVSITVDGLSGLIVGNTAVVNAKNLSITGNYDVWGGFVNVDKGGNFTVDTLSGVGSIYSETLGTSAITVEDAPVYVEGTGTWAGYYSDIDDALKAVKDSKSTEATVTVNGSTTLNGDYTGVNAFPTLDITVAEKGNLRNNGKIAFTDFTVDGRFTNSGTVSGTNAITGDGRVVNDGTMNAPVFVADYQNNATSEIKLSGDSTGTNWYPANQTITVPAGETWTIIAGNTIVIPGTLNVEGNLVIEEGGRLVIGATGCTTDNGTDVSRVGPGTANIEGTLTVEYGATLAVAAGSIDVNGTANIDGTVMVGYGFTAMSGMSGDLVSVATAVMTATLNINSNTTLSETSVIYQVDGTKVVVAQDVTMTLEGQFKDAVFIYNSGIVVIDSVPTNDNGDIIYSEKKVTVYMMADGASVEVQNMATTSGGVTIDDSKLPYTDADRNKVTIGDTNNTLLNFNSNNEKSVISGLTVVENYDGLDSKKVPKNSMDISGNISGELIALADTAATDDRLAAYLSLAEGKFTVSDAGEGNALSLGEKVTLDNYGTLTVSGYVPVNKTAAIANLKGTITLDGNGHIYMTETATNEINGIVNAAHYITTVNTDDFRNYVTADAAIAAANADSNIDEITLYGKNKVTVSATVPAIDFTFEDRAELTIGSEKDRTVVLTIAAGADYNGTGTTIVEGTLYFTDKTDLRMPETDIKADVVSKQVDAEGKEVKNGWARYTNIYTAMDAAVAGDVINVFDGAEVTLDRDFTVKEGVTLVIPDNGKIIVNNGVTLTVAGTLESKNTSGGITAQNEFDDKAENNTATANGKKSSAIVVTGILKVMETVNYKQSSLVDNLTGSYIDGAYYTDGEYNYVSPLAVAVSATVLPTIVDDITLKGTIAEGDIAFSPNDNGCERIVIDTGAKVTLSSLTLSDEAVLIDENAADGTFTGTVTVGDASIQASKVTGINVDSADGLTVSATVPYNNSNDKDETNATLAATAGTVIVGTISGDMTVAEGATLTVAAVTTANPNPSGSVTDELFVDGTVTIGSNQGLTVGTLYVDGTVNVAVSTDTAAAGSLTVGTDGAGSVYVGLNEKFETTGAGTVTGEVGCETVYAVAGATVSDETLGVGTNAEKKSTEYVVEGATWMTVYTNDSNMNVAFGKDSDKNKSVPVENAYFNGTWIAEDGSKIAANNDTAKVGTDNYTVVTAEVTYDIYVINLRADQNAVSSISIDGNIMQFGMISTPGVNGGSSDYYYGYTAVVAAGSHTISYTLANGYSGEGVLTVNGTQQSGLTFTTEGNPEIVNGVQQKTVTYNLQLTGFEKSGYVPDSPDTGSDSGDSGMTITDYLLIVLVVLIIVMAIIVAMRLMRS